MRTLVDAILIALYVGMIAVANAVVTRYGQEALPFTAFLMIPLDLVIRDLLQDRWQVKRRGVMYALMLALIFGGSLISYWTTIASARIATASMTAFCLTGIIDLLTYQAMVKYGRIFRINAATFVAAITDTVIFVVIAFDDADTMLVIYQIAAKCCGGMFWSLVLYRFFRSSKDVALREILAQSSRVVSEDVRPRSCPWTAGTARALRERSERGSRGDQGRTSHPR